MVRNSERLEQALVDAESLRAQAELTCRESEVAYAATRQALQSSQRALAAAVRTSEIVRQLVEDEGPDETR